MNSNNSNMATSFQHSSDGANVWQPVMMASVNKEKRKSKYPRMQNIVINVFSGFCITLGLASIGIQIAALVIYATELYNYVYFAADVVGHGIWAGSFYVIAGSLGIAAAYKRTTSLLVWTVVLSGLSIASAITASTLAGIAASHGVSYNCYSDLCYTWLALEWSLMAISILASIISIILVVVVSVPLCCSSRRNNNVGNQQGFHFVAGQQQQPMYFPSQQPMMMQQQYQPNFQASNVPQQFQQQPQMPFVTAYPTAPYTQAQQQQTPVSVPQQQQKPSESEAVEVVKVQTTE